MLHALDIAHHLHHHEKPLRVGVVCLCFDMFSIARCVYKQHIMRVDICADDLLSSGQQFYCDTLLFYCISSTDGICRLRSHLCVCG